MHDLSTLDAQIAELTAKRTALLFDAPRQPVIRALEDRVAALQQQRAGVLAEHADSLDDPAVQRMVDAHDAQIAQLQTQIARNRDAQTGAGKARAIAYAAECREAAGAGVAAAVALRRTPIAAAANETHENLARLRQSLHNYRELSRQCGRMAATPMRPLTRECGRQVGIMVANLHDEAASYSRTVDQLLSVLESREAREMDLVAENLKVADRIEQRAAHLMRKVAGLQDGA